MCPTPIVLNLPFKYSAHWKQQGITYLQYLGMNTKIVRACLKVCRTIYFAIFLDPISYEIDSMFD